MVELGGGAVLVVVDAVGVELEALLRRVDGDGDGAHGGYCLHQLLFITVGDVHEAGVVGAGVLGVVPARPSFQLIRETQRYNNKQDWEKEKMCC